MNHYLSALAIYWGEISVPYPIKITKIPQASRHMFVTDKDVDKSDANADANGHFYNYPSHTSARHNPKQITYLAIGGNTAAAPAVIVQTKYRELPWNIDLDPNPACNY